LQYNFSFHLFFCNSALPLSLLTALPQQNCVYNHATLSVAPTFFTILSKVVMQHPIPNKDFLQALTFIPLLHTALPHYISQFYREAKELSRRFPIDDSTLPPYAGVLSVFHPQVAASEAGLTKNMT
jgi:hypothetical protein